MNGYTKLFQSIVTSSVWQEPDETRLVWITMLALADQNGFVEASVPGLANVAKVSLEKTTEALVVLESPDKWSRSQEHEGRRIKAIEGGWVVLNHGKYRGKLSQSDRREYQRVKQAEYRKKRKSKEQRREENRSRERRYVEADSRGDRQEADRIAAEGLEGDGDERF